jgi:hypothetical protein
MAKICVLFNLTLLIAEAQELRARRDSFFENLNIPQTFLFLTGILNIGWLILTFDNVKGGLKPPKKAKA